MGQTFVMSMCFYYQPDHDGGPFVAVWRYYKDTGKLAGTSRTYHVKNMERFADICKYSSIDLHIDVTHFDINSVCVEYIRR